MHGGNNQITEIACVQVYQIRQTSLYRHNDICQSKLYGNYSNSTVSIVLPEVERPRSSGVYCDQIRKTDRGK